MKQVLKGRPIYEEEKIKRPKEDLKEFSIEELRENISYTPRQFIFKIQDVSVRFYLIRLSESKKYGTKTMEKMDENMSPCQKINLSLYDNIVFSSSKTIEGKGKLPKNEIQDGIYEKPNLILIICKFKNF